MHPRELEPTVCRRLTIAIYKKVRSSARPGGSIVQLIQQVKPPVDERDGVGYNRFDLGSINEPGGCIYVVVGQNPVF